jgi:hypothetical protein
MIDRLSKESDRMMRLVLMCLHLGLAYLCLSESPTSGAHQLNCIPSVRVIPDAYTSANTTQSLADFYHSRCGTPDGVYETWH